MTSHSPQEYFAREYFELHPGKRSYLSYLANLLRQHGVEGGSVLDVGSGYGFWLEHLTECGHRPQGLELSPYAATKSRNRVDAPVSGCPSRWKLATGRTGL